MMKSALLSLLMLSSPVFAASKAASHAADRAADEAIERAAETLIAEGAKLEDIPVVKSAAGAGATGAGALSASATGVANHPAKDARSEEETPVVMSEPVAPKTSGSIAWRLLISIAVIAAAGVGLTLASRKWGRRSDLGGAKSRIEMMHQFHLGPRKSLALVRVAGECMLIGVTDQNINMLKSITLIDDDMAAALNQDFNGFLEDEFSVADVNSVVDRRS